MPDPIIEVRNISKRYLLGSIGSTRLRDDVERVWRRLRGQDKESEPMEFWALRDVSFDVMPGEVVGIVGRNGAGKSTLLKILSRITEPTSGDVFLSGRVASLLEVGTGFHPDLTGRENIFLNGAILGMTKREIKAKFGEIVAFAELEKFVDTPVKRYSSGMYVRLAFAVAAHLEPEILVVDEVLAVGDQQFQEKCLGKMREISHAAGRTVLFVSHNLSAVSALTQRCVYLKAGQVVKVGPTGDILQLYANDAQEPRPIWRAETATDHPLQITEVSVIDESGAASIDVEASGGFTIQVNYTVRKNIRQGLIEAYIFTSDSAHLVTLGEHDAKPEVLNGRLPGDYRASIRIPGDLLNLGRYFIRINSGVGSTQTFDYADTVSFNIVERKKLTARQNRKGHLVPLIPWETERLGENAPVSLSEPTVAH